MSGVFGKSDERRERAHGDGLEIGYDSPEALEEIFWMSFWSAQYSDEGIELWDASDYQDEAHTFFVEHMKKIVALRRPDRLQDGRYLSKNNGNIARLDLLRHMFPAAKILVPVRHPMEHAASLLRQHLNFLELHKKDPFIRRYMADIGHFEFGELHRVIRFPFVRELISGRDPLTLDYWVGYWIAAFEYLSERRDHLVIVSHEETVSGKTHALKEICRRLEIPEDGMLDEAASIFREPPAKRIEHTALNTPLRDRAERLYASLVN